MLCGTTAYELSEWEAYERATGPLGRQYSDDMLARIHEQLQMLTYVLAATNTGKDQENPIPEPKEVPRPPDLFRRAEVKQAAEPEEAMSLGDAVAFFEARQQQK